MFTGQGSQYPGMGADFYRDEPVYRAAVDRCLSLLEPAKADELRRLVFTPGAASEANRVSLQRTETAQLALFIVHVALAELLGAWGVRPAIMIGHSIGDYAAAHLAGVLSLEHAIALVTTRGRLMGEMEPGTMLSVVAELDELPALPADISPAAVNAPKLVVLAGPTQAVEAYEAVLAAAGFVSRRLSTSHAFHSAMMDPMLGDFERAVRSVALAAPATPFISSLTGAPVDAADAVDPSFWARQIRNPVQFARGCAALMSADVTAVVEVGPGRGLTALARQCGLAAADIECIATMPEPSEAGFHLAVALGRLWLAGVDVAWDALYEGEKRVRIPLPTTPFTRQRYWIDPALKISARESAEKRPDVR
jgi:acyl transferase domain-containing protein